MSGGLHDRGLVRDGTLVLEAVRSAAADVGSGQVVAFLAERAVESDDPTGVGLPRQIVDLVVELPDFQPDVEELFATYRRAQGSQSPATQILVEWLVGHLEPVELIERIAPFLRSVEESDRVLATKLARRAYEVGGTERPDFGGSGGRVGPIISRTEPPVPEMVEDYYPSETKAAEPIEPVGPIEANGNRGLDDPSAAVAKPRGSRRVATGFSGLDTPDRSLSQDLPLRTDTPYWYWFEIGDKPLPGAIEDRLVLVDLSELPEEAILDVVLFSLDPGLQVDSSACVGRLLLDRSGAVIVNQQPGGTGGGVAYSRRRHTRLFFPVRTSEREGRFRLRANLYYRQALIQSRLVRVVVAESPQPTPEALVATVDYNYSLSLDFARVSLRQEHRLSLMVNDNGDGSHGFMFVGSDGDPFVCPARLTESEIDKLIERARNDLRRAAYGNEGIWERGFAYRYEGGPKPDLLQEDLVSLARSGRAILGGIEARFACQKSGEVGAIDRLRRLMRTPGFVEITSKVSPSLMIPASILYDRPLDAGVELTLCPSFQSALADHEDLETNACFTGYCPNLEDDRIVCPSGFWGYRHDLGLPSSLAIEAKHGATRRIHWHRL